MHQVTECQLQILTTDWPVNRDLVAFSAHKKYSSVNRMLTTKLSKIHTNPDVSNRSNPYVLAIQSRSYNAKYLLPSLSSIGHQLVNMNISHPNIIPCIWSNSFNQTYSNCKLNRWPGAKSTTCSWDSRWPLNWPSMVSDVSRVPHQNPSLVNRPYLAHKAPQITGHTTFIDHWNGSINLW